MTKLQLMACREIAYELFKLILIISSGIIQIWMVYEVYQLKAERNKP